MLGEETRAKKKELSYILIIIQVRGLSLIFPGNFFSFNTTSFFPPAKMSPDPTRDEALVAAVKSAKPPRPNKWRPILRLLIFHFLTVGTLPIAFLANFIRAAIPFLRPHRRMSFVAALGTLMVRYSIRMMVLTSFQPLPPREHGWREQPGLIGASLATLNMSGPGSRVAHPLLTLKAATKQAHKQSGKRRNDRVWFDAPQLPYYRGILTLKHGKGEPQKVQGCSTYNGPAMVDISWTKSRTRGFWFLPNGEKQHPPAREPGGQKEPVVLYFHGGAGVTFSAGDLFMGEILASNLAKSSKLPVFSVDYNLAPYAPFPIPLVQALGGYLYLTDTLGYRPDQIFIGGDSFGSHLTLALERYLRLEMPEIRGDVENQTAAAPGLLLLSPWLSTLNDPWKSRPANLGSDIITLTYGDWGVESMQLGPKYEKRCSLDLLDPWLSPVYKSVEEMAQLPPLFVGNGGVEVLLDEGKEFVRKARQAKADVTHVITPFQPHDFYTLPFALPHSRKVYTQFGHWARKHVDYAPYVISS